MSQWTSKYAVMHDLSVAQGRIVPASLEATFGNNKPAALNINEETEEHHFQDSSGDTEFHSGPDLGLIKKMLSMVKEETYSSDDEIDKIVVISKLNPLVPDFVPSNSTDTQTEESKPKKEVTPRKHKKKRWERNVALTSLLNAIANGEAEPPEVKEGVDLTPKNPTVIQDPLPIMFRRKQVEKPAKKETASSVTCNASVSNYVPSSLASDYYNKFLEKSKLKLALQEDLWSKSQRQMKEIDNKRKLEAIESSSGSSNVSTEDTTAKTPSDTSPTSSVSGLVHGVDAISLPQQRHLLTGPCIVCEMVEKHNYVFKE